jgi:hypothetical protein
MLYSYCMYVHSTYLDGFKEAPSSRDCFPLHPSPDTSLAHISTRDKTSPGTPSIHLVLNQASFRTDAGKRSAYLVTWMQRGMKVLTRPARTRSIARFVGLVRHSSRTAAAAAMALKFPVYPPARYAGESVPVKRPKVRIECELVCVGLRFSRLASGYGDGDSDDGGVNGQQLTSESRNLHASHMTRTINSTKTTPP